MRQVMITGASSDIGLTLCRLYLEKGFRIIAHYNRGQSSFNKFIESAENVTPMRIDLSDPANLERSISEQAELFTDSDVLINAAATMKPVSFAEITAEDLIMAFTVNAVPAVMLMRTIAPAMAKRGWGRIVNLSSIGVKFGGGAASFAYALSKHAMELMPYDHKAWAARNLFVNTLRIGVTNTRFHRNDQNKDMAKRVSLIPVGRMATCEEIAKTIYWFGSEENTFTTGQTITIAGGE